MGLGARTVAVMAACLGVACSVLPAQERTTVPAPPCPSTPGQVIMDRVNAERVGQGLAPLVADTVLARAARIHADDMARSGRVGHDGSDGSDPSQRLDRVGYPWESVGENLAAGQESPAEAMAGWMRSEGHRRNILGPGFTGAGVARVVAPGSEWSTYWVMVFAAPLTPAPGVVRCHP